MSQDAPVGVPVTVLSPASWLLLPLISDTEKPLLTRGSVVSEYKGLIAL